MRIVCLAHDLRLGVKCLLECTGLGKIKPNTVFLGFKTNWRESIVKEEQFEDGSKSLEKTKTTKNYVNIIQNAFDHQFGVAILRTNFDKEMKVLRILNEKREGTIDVWWLFDDGGLTLLIPYLLSQSRFWKQCKLRVFTPQATTKVTSISSSKIRMVNLLKMFRIDVSCVEEFDGIHEKPSAENIETFKNLAGHSVEGEQKKRSLRHIRLGELLKEHSKDASLIVMTLPVPSEAVEPTMYMSWLEMMTKDLPPILLIRGNHTNVLTFYT